ncbi:hypothetical protein ACFUMH_04020 [Cellulomonas sp. NPDC057328]|uniref:hypothetical protein n=1 Tax=Cellulomonas sp. NPDC057328 TaxID=3346101 RepID=UPI0036354F9B
MSDPIGIGALGVRLTRAEAESSRPWAPEVPETAHDRRMAERRARRAQRVLARAHAPVARPRAAAAGALHRLADALAPEARDARYVDQRAGQHVGHAAH